MSRQGGKRSGKGQDHVDMQDGPSRKPILFPVILVLVAVCSYYVYPTIPSVSAPTSDSNISSLRPFLSGEVPRRSAPALKDPRQFTRELQRISEERQPVVLTDTLVGDWPAVHTWTPEYITKHVPRFLDVAKHHGRLFSYYNEDAILANATNLHWRAPAEDLDMSPQLFFQELATGPGEKGDYYYYNGKIELLGPKLKGDITHQDAFRCPFTDKGRSLNVWVSGQGMRVQNHYDSFFNYFIQIRGTKRFVLFPPSEASYLYLYPRFHPSYRQSQVYLHQVNTTRFPKALQARGLLVTLRAGEIMYLPPFWFHYVEYTDDISISANFWCMCQEFFSMEEAITSAVPVESDWPEQRLHNAVAVYLSLLISHFHSPGTARDDMKGIRETMSLFVHDLLVSRFDPIFPAETSSTCPRSQCIPDIDSESWLDLAQHVTSRGHLDKLIGHFQDMHDGGIRDILLGNYVEELVSYVVGAEGIPAFLRRCFTA